jgi:aspartate/methionine/tyrosine aminotransferase
MNFSPPQWIKDSATEALSTVVANHYSHPKGRMRLREAIRDYYSPVFGRELNVETEILVTSGANEGKHVRPSHIRIVFLDNVSPLLRPILRVHCFPGAWR